MTYQLCVELILESLEHAYLATIYNFFCLLSSFDPIYITETPPCHKLAKVCMKFKFISICTYVCGVCPMYCWFSNSLVPRSLGTILFVFVVPGTTGDALDARLTYKEDVETM